LNPWHYLVTLLEACLGDLDNETASVVRSAIELQKNEEEPEV